MSDMRVLGLVHGTHIIEDIMMDVPYGVTVTIPAEKAARSKDLHRAISSRCVFPLPANANVQPPPNARLYEELGARVRGLEAELQQLQADNQRLRTENAQLRGENQKLSNVTQSSNVADTKLDAILAAIQGGALVRTVVAGSPAVRHVQRDDVVDLEAPMFIPSEIKFKDAEARIEVRTEETSSTGISDAASKLRKFKKESGQ